MLDAARNARRRARAALILAAMLLPTSVMAQGAFQIRFSVDRSAHGPVRVSGTLTNEGRLDVLDVYVSAEAVDTSGKVVGRGVSFVCQSLPARATVSFIVSIPAAPTATRFGVNVSSFRPGFGVQAP